MNYLLRRTFKQPIVRIITALLALFAHSDTLAHEVDHHHDSDRVNDMSNPRSAKRLLQLFRRTGDDRHLDQAWERLDAQMDSGQPIPQILIDAAFVAQARHQFDLAEAMTKDALSLNPSSDQAWLLLASLHLVQGDPVAAAKACSALQSSALLIVLTCKARVAAAGTEVEPIRSQLDALLGVVGRSTRNPAQLAWSLSVAGDLYARDNARKAKKYYEESLRFEESTQVRSALVDLLLAPNQLLQARAVLEAGAAALPLVIRRLILDLRLGEIGPGDPRIVSVDREFQQWISRGDWLHAREMTRFYVDVMYRPALARRLALTNLSLQREPEDVRLEMRTRL